MLQLNPSQYKLIVNSNIFNLDVNFIHEKSFNTNKESNLQIFIPKLGVQIKTNILDKNIKGNTIVKFPKNKIEFEHEFINNTITLNYTIQNDHLHVALSLPPLLIFREFGLT